jgi:hypothetical protein
VAKFIAGPGGHLSALPQCPLPYRLGDNGSGVEGRK